MDLCVMSFSVGLCINGILPFLKISGDEGKDEAKRVEMVRMKIFCLTLVHKKQFYEVHGGSL